MRFTAKDRNSVLSMAQNETNAIISVIETAPPTENLMNFYREWEREMVNRFRGRPHHGKINFLTAEDMVYLYGREEIENFKCIAHICDRKGLFVNPHLRRLFNLG